MFTSANSQSVQTMAAEGDDGLEETVAGIKVCSATGVDLRASRNFIWSHTHWMTSQGMGDTRFVVIGWYCHAVSLFYYQKYYNCFGRYPIVVISVPSSTGKTIAIRMFGCCNNNIPYRGFLEWSSISTLQHGIDPQAASWGSQDQNLITLICVNWQLICIMDILSFFIWLTFPSWHWTLTQCNWWVVSLRLHLCKWPLPMPRMCGGLCCYQPPQTHVCTCATHTQIRIFNTAFMANAAHFSTSAQTLGEPPQICQAHWPPPPIWHTYATTTKSLCDF